MKIEFTIDKEEKNVIVDAAAKIAVEFGEDPQEIEEEMKSLGKSYVHQNAYGTLDVETFPSGNLVVTYTTTEGLTKDCMELSVGIAKDFKPLVSLVKSAIILYTDITSKVTDRVKNLFMKYNTPIDTVECYEVTIGYASRKAVVTKDKFGNIDEVTWDGYCPINHSGITLEEFFAKLTPVKTLNTENKAELDEIKKQFLNNEK